jgi:hypothetical protein
MDNYCDPFDGFRQFTVSLRKLTLDFDSAVQSIHHTDEVREQILPGSVHPPMKKPPRGNRVPLEASTSNPSGGTLSFPSPELRVMLKVYRKTE